MDSREAWQRFKDYERQKFFGIPLWGWFFIGVAAGASYQTWQNKKRS